MAAVESPMRPSLEGPVGQCFIWVTAFPKMCIVLSLSCLHGSSQNHLVIIWLTVWASGTRLRVIDLDSNQ